jgi:hypothetical protein
VRTRKLALVAASGLAAMTLLTAAPALAAAKPTAHASAVPTQNGVKFDPSKAKCSTVPGASASTENCLEIQRLPLSDLTATQLTQRQQAMARLSAKGKQAQASAAPAAAAPTACGFPTNGVPTGVFAISPSRLMSCSDFFYEVIAYEEVDGVFSVVGDFSFEDQSWVTFSATSLSWVHDMQTISYGGDGILSDGVGGFMSSNCTTVTTACTATSTGAPDPQVVFLAPDSTYSWEWNEQDAGPASTTAGAVDNLDAVLGVQWNLNLGTTNDVENETGGLYGRCDTLAVKGTKGCVDEHFIPSLYLSYAEYGASVDMINYYEENIPPYYGNEYSPDTPPEPLHRLVNPTQQSSNRATVCGSSFTSDATITADLAPYNDTDSCDEYPFASTYESGAMATGADGNSKPFVTTGTDCAQSTANYTPVTDPNETPVEPQEWATVTINADTGSEPCIRGHIPNKLNGGVGTEYRTFIQQERLIDKDAFWVEVTP